MTLDELYKLYGEVDIQLQILTAKKQNYTNLIIDEINKQRASQNAPT